MNRKEKIEKITNKLARCKAELVGATTSAMVAMPMIAQAGWGDGNADAGSLIGSIAEIVVNIFPFIGIFFVIAGVFKLIMAYRNDQPEGQSAAAKDIVIGVVFLAFRLFVWNALKGALGL